jgi:hypothetical protein
MGTTRDRLMQMMIYAFLVRGQRVPINAKAASTSARTAATMTGIFIFLVAVIWGSLSGQFVVQVVTSFVIAIIYLAGIPFSKVSRGMNFTGALVSVGQTIFFTVLFFWR